MTTLEGMAWDHAVALAAMRAYAAVRGYAAGEARADAEDVGIPLPFAMDRLEVLHDLMDANLLLEDAAYGDWWDGLGSEDYWDALAAVSVGLDALLREGPVVVQ